jgi:hypothetical protein
VEFLGESVGAQGALAVLWDAFTTRRDKTSYEVIRFSMLLVMLIFTWLVGGLISCPNVDRSQSPEPSRLGSQDRISMWALETFVYSALPAPFSSMD